MTAGEEATEGPARCFADAIKPARRSTQHRLSHQPCVYNSMVLPATVTPVIAATESKRGGRGGRSTMLGIPADTAAPDAGGSENELI